MRLVVVGSRCELHTRTKSAYAGENFGVEPLERKDKHLVLLLALHAADNCNPAQPLEMAMEWTWRIMEEFFRQGKKQLELCPGLQIGG